MLLRTVARLLRLTPVALHVSLRDRARLARLVETGVDGGALQETFAALQRVVLVTILGGVVSKIK